ncbi:carboxyl transferase domain-containing protein, partial [Pseudomonas aeruginosa]
ADEAARFSQLGDAFDIPLASHCDTPCFIGGPEAEKPATVPHLSRMFGSAAILTVPIFTGVRRKNYALGAHAMAALTNI